MPAVKEGMKIFRSEHTRVDILNKTGKLKQKVTGYTTYQE